jgi:prolyl oligopeptidase
MKPQLCCWMVLAGVALASCEPAPMRTHATPPATTARPVTETIHGTTLTDPYRWLEGDVTAPADPQKVTPEVVAWTDAQNRYTREVLDNLPGRTALEERLRPLMEVGTVSAPAIRGTRYFFSRREGSQNQAVRYWREGARGEDHVLLDPAQLDPSGLTTIEWVSPSADGKLAAFGSYKAGDENTTLHLLDVDAGSQLPLEIPNKVEPPDWLPDGSGFVYRNLKNPKDPYSGQVMFHRMGTSVDTDVVLFRQYTTAENAALATTWGPFGRLSRDGKWLVLGYWVDTRSNDLWVVDFERFRKTGQIEKTVVSVGVPGSVGGSVIDDVLYLKTTKGAAMGRLVAVDAKAPDLAKARVVVPERADAVIEGVAFARGRLEHGRGLRSCGRDAGRGRPAGDRLGRRRC